MTHRRAIAGQGGAVAWTPPDDCVLWLAHANSGDLDAGATWPDASGAGNHGTLLGTAVVTSAGIDLVSAGATNGVAVTLPTLAAWSFSAWVSITQTANYRRLFSSASGACELAANAGGALSRFISGGTWATSNLTVTAGWRHVAATYDGTTMRMYLDGTEASETFTGRASQIRRIGRADTDKQTQWMRYMDDIQVYSRGLSAEELAGIRTLSPGRRA